MSPMSSTATRSSVSASFAAVAAFATLMGVAALASAQVADTCPPEHRKVDKRIHDRMHRQRSDREPIGASRRRARAVGAPRVEETPGRQRVIIRAKAGMRGTLKAAGRNRGHGIRADHDFINAFSAEVDEADLARLAADPRIESVSFDATMQGDQIVVEEPARVGRPAHVDRPANRPQPDADSAQPGSSSGHAGGERERLDRRRRHRRPHRFRPGAVRRFQGTHQSLPRLHASRRAGDGGVRRLWPRHPYRRVDRGRGAAGRWPVVQRASRPT